MDSYPTFVNPQPVQRRVPSRRVRGDMLTINAINPSAQTRTITYSYIRDAQNTIVNPRNGPWTSLGPAFSFHNNGQAAFIGDISINRQMTSYALGTFTPPGTFATPRPTEVLTRPMLADNGRIS